MSTPAIAYLKHNKIAHEIVKYEPREKGAEFAARAIGYPLECTVKTLVVELDREAYCLALLPGNTELNLKKLAGLFGVKRTAMVTRQTAERLTGYRVGGISPFGMQRRMPVVMEERILLCAKVLINAGQRGVMLKMAPADIAAAIDGRVASIARK